MEIASPSGRRLTISGTASISQDGRTRYQNDARSQVALTMEVVDAILRSSGYSLRDLTRAVAYFKHSTDAPVFEEWCANHGHTSMPVIPVHCAVCREDLLFELEADAYRPA
jgi:enamine deaminase RidA (YjgF/YER057c/UK114 family)